MNWQGICGPTGDIEMCESGCRSYRLPDQPAIAKPSWSLVMKFVMPAIIVTAALMNAGPAFAQTYDPHYPVCMHVYGEQIGERMDCTFNSLGQCAATASGLPATCLINPYFADGRTRTPPRRHNERY
jgi:hypothetical protein